MNKIIKSAFILHSFPMLYGPDCIPELNEIEEFYCLIPTEELALLYSVSWPIVIDHVDETIKENVKGYTTSEIIDKSFLYCPKIEIDKNRCTIQDIKNFRKWNETSTCYTATHIKIDEPYEYIDTTGVLGFPGKGYLIKYHIINIQPKHLAIVEHGRTGYKGALRNPIDRVVNNSNAKYVNSDIIQDNNLAITVLNETYRENEDMKTKPEDKNKEVETKEDDTEQKSAVDNNAQEETSNTSIDYNAIGESVGVGLQPLLDAINAMSLKLDDMIAMKSNHTESVAANKSKAKGFKQDKTKAVENSALEPDDDDEDDNDSDEDSDDENSDDEDSGEKNILSSNKMSDIIQRSVAKAMNKVLLTVPNINNNKSEAILDPYQSFANRYKD